MGAASTADVAPLFLPKSFAYSKHLCIFAPELHQEWRFSPPTGLRMIVGSGGKRMRVRMFNSLKINDYGNQED